MSWKDTVAKAYTTVPKSVKEAIWKTSVALTVISSLLTGFAIWRSPSFILGLPVPRQSIIERLAHEEDLKEQVWEHMEDFFYSHRPYGLMLVSWEELNSMVGIWVRPADKIPGKSGPHSLSPDMRVLGGPFLFGECAQTESLAMPGRLMVACPVSSEYDVQGYVAVIVDPNASRIDLVVRLVEVLAHRISDIIY